MGGVEAGLIMAIRAAKHRDLHWPSIIMAVASAALLAAGVLRHYADVYFYRSVRGISFIFVGIDALGDVFSLVSVVFQPKLDVLGLVIYGTELGLWIGIFICGAHYNLRSWVSARKEQKVSQQFGMTRVSRTDGLEASAVATSMALDALPSSTSVFRTHSGDLEVVRQRSVSSTVEACV